MSKWTTKKIHDRLMAVRGGSYANPEPIPTEQDILDIGLREALRRLEDHMDYGGLTVSTAGLEKILGVRLEDKGGE